jgi:Mg/Co/Ni transporter MgtE
MNWRKIDWKEFAVGLIVGIVLTILLKMRLNL